MQYDAFLFDLDGVLIDSEPLHWQAWHTVLRPLGIELDWDTYRTHAIGVEDRQMLEFLAQRAPNPTSVDTLWAYYPEKTRVFFELLAKHSPSNEPLRETLRRAQRQGVAMAVVSSSGRTEVLGALDAFGLREFFTEVIAREDVRHPKPDPEPYRLAAERLGAQRPLVFEDSEPGLASARAAGFDAIHVRHPTELPQLLERLLGS